MKRNNLKSILVMKLKNKQKGIKKIAKIKKEEAKISQKNKI